MIETWKDIEGYEGLYQVSDWGRVKSLPKEWDLGAKGIRRQGERMMKPAEVLGYSVVSLRINKVSRKMFKIHRLVAIAFIPKITGKEYVNHIDGNKANNYVKNLEWCTMSENNHHAYDTGLKFGPVGEKQWNSKLKKDQVIEIFKLSKSGKYSDTEIAERYGVVRTVVNRIKNGKRWAYFTKDIAV